MTGSLQIKKLSSGNSYYYIKLSFKNPLTKKWNSRTYGTGLPTNGNKRKALAMVDTFIQKYSYLEKDIFEADSHLDPNISFCNYLDLWLESKKSDIRIPTYETYSYRIKSMKRYFSDKKLRLIDITPKVLDSYFKWALKFGKENKKTKKREPLSVRSVRSFQSILYAVFDQAVIDGLINTNTVKSVSVHGKKNRDYDEEYLFLSEDEISEMLHFLAENYPRLVGIAFMGVYYGLRRSEILGLKWSAIDYTKKIININHTIVRVSSTTATNSVKTQAGKRSLNLFPTAEKCLAQLRETQNDYSSFYKSAYKNKSSYVFTWENGTPYDPDYISKLFRKAMTAFGRPEITLHKLRHTCASLLINKGWDIKKLQYWLGHTDIQTTLNIYAHFDRHRLNASTNDLTEISLAAADLF